MKRDISMCQSQLGTCVQCVQLVWAPLFKLKTPLQLKICHASCLNQKVNNFTNETRGKSYRLKHQRGKNSFNMGLIPHLDDVVFVVVAGVKAPGEHPGHL